MKSSTGRNMLHSLHHFDPPKTPKQGRAVMTVKEVADFLGVSVTTVYRLTRRDPTFPAYRIGTDWRWNREDVDRWRFELAQQHGRK